jgi:hypothetical protein
MKDKKVSQAKPSLSLQQLLLNKVNENKMRVSIPFQNFLDFNPEEPQSETREIMGRTQKVIIWSCSVDNTPRKVVFLLGQVARLYNAVKEGLLPDGVELNEVEQAVVVLTDKETANRRGVKTPNGNLGFLNLTPCTIANSGQQVEVSAFVD